ncbi:MAG: diguanylate cyclase [Deltaproteobacteria bacterium]|nr:diguanylate cyclase [Deltaproteobacteria bacterium]
MAARPTRRLTRESMETTLASTASEPRVPCVTVLSGPVAGFTARLPDGRQVVGRDQGSWLCVDEDGVSRAHLAFLVEGMRVQAQDLGSTNGTFCNGQPLTTRVLQDGDQLRLGETTCLKFEHKTTTEHALLQRQYEAATHDALTGCFNRKYLLERLSAEVAFTARHPQPLAVLMVDLDHFKNVNDQHGHAAGDLVLTRVARMMSSLLRLGDVLCRYGGEEFVILLRETTVPSAVLAAERLRRGVEHLGIPHAGTDLRVTLSIGVTGTDGTTPVTAQALLDWADHALYAAKNGGRNRVVAHTP